MIANTKSAVLLIFLTAFSFSGAALLHSVASASSSLEYWIWRNSDMKLVNEHSRLIIYQGNLNERWEFEPLGVQPINIPQSNIGIVLRLYSLGDPGQVSQLFKSIADDWARFGIVVDEFQIDYDSASYNLSEYASWLKSLSGLVDVELSATGLSTYLWDNPTGLVQVSHSVSYIAMQLYQGRKPHANHRRIVDELNYLKLPYKLGITTDEEFEEKPSLCKRHCLSTIVFLNIKD